MSENIQRPEAKSNRFGPAYHFRHALIADHWLTPDTYCNAYSEFIDGPAVYLFATCDRREDVANPIVAYVGMSTRLVRRIAKHNIRPMINGPHIWISCWFKPTPVDSLREEERRYIQKFNPAWNIIGKVRGAS